MIMPPPEQSLPGRHWRSWFTGLLIGAALVAAILHLVGVPAKAAFAGVMLLRLWTLWLPLLPGLWMTRRLNRPGRTPPVRNVGRRPE